MLSPWGSVVSISCHMGNFGVILIRCFRSMMTTTPPRHCSLGARARRLLNSHWRGQAGSGRIAAIMMHRRLFLTAVGCSLVSEFGCIFYQRCYVPLANIYNRPGLPQKRLHIVYVQNQNKDWWLLHFFANAKITNFQKFDFPLCWKQYISSSS